MRGPASDPNASDSQDAAYYKISGQQQESKPAPTTEESSGERQTGSATTSTDQGKSTEEKNREKAEQEQVRKLKARDREVRAHEQAHLSALGPYKSGGASYTFETGPDGQR
ncbi:MAG: hypothetical protein IT290_00885, partial [Deltaproteobacteria bacterium]|nr:hypothetical protein [Deltaproteobacteria bacterium]